MSSRRLARERVMQTLYALEIGGGEAQFYLETFIGPDVKDDPKTVRFAESLLLRTLDRIPEIDEIIRRHTQNWDLTRVTLVDHILLRMAICELITFEDIPPKVTLNEAIDIAKKYSTLKSGQFINGVLDAVVKELKDSGQLKKSGRGLIGMDDLQRGKD